MREMHELAEQRAQAIARRIGQTGPNTVTPMLCNWTTK